MLNEKKQIYRGLLKNLSTATVGLGVLAWTTDSHGIYVSDGTNYVRVSPNTQVWSTTDATTLRALVQAAGGGVFVGDIAINEHDKITYVLAAFATGIWAGNTHYNAGDTLIDSNGNLQTVTIGGISGSSEPTWNTSGTTTSGGVTWDKGNGFIQIASEIGTNTHDEPLTDGNSNFIFANGDVVVVIGVPN